ncbi:MAG: formate dehydrogenase subunit gamma [Rhodospirillales bacterium]|nr:formate dehydrogenase subunit gamma [Rhodospirillales bacterium]
MNTISMLLKSMLFMGIIAGLLVLDLPTNLFQTSNQVSAQDSLGSSSPANSTAMAPSKPGSSVRPPASQKWGVNATVPSNIIPQDSSTTVWGKIRLGARGSVSIPNKDAGLLVQSGGETWRQYRMGPLVSYSGWIILAVIVLLTVFYFVRGRMKISAGPSKNKVERFKLLDRITHWMTAIPFCVLALTGLNLIYGRDLLLPIIGPEAFTAVTVAGKYMHNFMGFAFIIGIVLMIILWARHNLLDKYDLGWIKAAGGMLSDKVHPPAKKFNFGQKIIFWLVVLVGASLSYSGISLMFPFEFSPFQGTFAFINNFGSNLPTNLEPIHEMQLTQSWHAILSVAMIAVIIAHIYIGSVGMEGAIDAMWDGEVDENWAREHHAAWVAELKGEPEPKPYKGTFKSPESHVAHE